MQKDMPLNADTEPPSEAEVPDVPPLAPELPAMSGPSRPARLGDQSSLPPLRSIPRKTLDTIRESQRAKEFRRRFFPRATSGDWNDWHWQIANRLRDIAALSRVLHLSPDEREGLADLSGHLPMSVTPYYASLLNGMDSADPLRLTIIPSAEELVLSPGESIDPLGEDGNSPVPGLIHRYPDRVLFLVTDFCSTYCRYCTRSRLVGHGHAPSRKRWSKGLAYIAGNKDVRDVILSGGDPLTLPDEELRWLLSSLRRIPHVEVIRIGTKVPTVLPQRITKSLVRMLREFHPLYASIHFAHPRELTEETAQACGRLADAGLPLGSQTVLLRGVNDRVETMRDLCQGLMRLRVRPYYLYQCDPIKGSAHFRTPVDTGLKIIQGLRGFTSGYAVPTFVIDAPGGGGKIPLLPDYVQGRDGGDLVLRNYLGREYRYPEYGPDTGALPGEPGGDR